MKKDKLILFIVSGICILSIIGMIFALTVGNKKKSINFSPPEFDKTAQSGIPSVDENLGWSKIHQEGMDYTAFVCGNILVKDQYANVYFTNIKENTVWIKLRIIDENKNLLGETGLIKPGEYIESVLILHPLKNGSKIQLKIMAYEPETYYSIGSVALNTIINNE